MKVSNRELKLPALHVEVSVRVVRTEKQLRYLRKSAVSAAPVPQYFWGADDQWYLASNIRFIRLAPWWLRFRTAWDLAEAEFDLELLDRPPFSWPTLFRQLALTAWYPDKSMNKKATAALRRCKSCREVTDWMERFTTFKVKY